MKYCVFVGLHSAKKSLSDSKMWLYYFLLKRSNKVKIKLEFLLNDTLCPQ